MFQNKFRFIFSLVLSVILSFFFIACTGKKQAEPIHWNEDACENCHMKLNDRKYGAEVITKHGRILTFDAVDCLLDFVKKNEALVEDVYVVDYFHSELISVRDASFVRSSKVHGPMGTNIFATKDTLALKEMTDKDTVRHFTWETLKKEVQSE
jgi:copper chaperone NosL